ncbi:Sin recombinase [Limosilactobacillus reuteri]|uniref:recombinase family protein n=1 Tax=Limosilactobacillus reuteri TaxID=1598 RepID=UPI0004DAC58B|nr:recombinase family protein [Limosilactobacillus reuteri]KEQ20290.1 Sin recombinase [Limosilactobacillus reuteri]MCC4357995.1 recombinase family protein [Limosilactobacillus reuteri]MCC4363038.1 recombinase family protein [Limosilactobacillus reuteri]MCC4365165.1 recombinase family protein [Limosilactobacillus reuteri]MCC4435433.1 recombinase family protein [Limosilactobacillus reuteri]
MALIFYARVSSKDQNLERQLYRAKQVNADKVFQDKKSGKNTERTGLKEMLNYIREEDTVEVVSLDRLSRNYNDIKKMVQLFKDKKVKLLVDDLPVTYTGNDLVDNFLLDMMISLMGFVAENERQKIRERQRQGIERAKQNGKYRGRTKKYAPNSTNREGRLVYQGIVNDYQTNNYKTKVQLAKKYGVSRQQLYRILNDIN